MNPVRNLVYFLRDKILRNTMVNKISNGMKKGFTIIEALVVIVILTVISVIVIGSFTKFNNNQSLNTAVSEITSTLNQARANTLASYDNLSYGVHFQSDKIILFSGGVFSSSDPDNKEIVLSTKVSISNITLAGGGSDIIFKRLTGKTDQDGTITLSLVSDPSKTETIIIQKSGIIE